MSVLNVLLSNSGGPGYSLPGRAQRAGSDLFISTSTKVFFLGFASCGLRPFGQQVARTTKKIVAPVFFCLLLAVTSLAHAQSNDTNTPPPDPAPASISQPSAPVTPQVISPNGAAPSQPDDIDDIRPPFFFFSPLIWFWIALVFVAAIALLFLLWKWLGKPAYLSPKSAYDLTLEKLEKARALLREEDPIPYATVVSEIIRGYLGQRFQTPSTRRTTEEFLRMMEANPNTPLAAHRDLLHQFLQSCDLVKFARYQPTQQELEEVQQRAFTFVHATNPALVPGPDAGGKT